MRDEIRNAVFARAATRWRRTHPKSFIGRLFSPIFGGKLDAILIVEHDEGDAESLLCEGNVVAAWRMDENGVCPVDLAELDSMEGKRGRIHLLRFFIFEDDSEVIANEMERPGQGTLLRFKVKRQESGVKLSFRQSSLLLGGYRAT